MYIDFSTILIAGVGYFIVLPLIILCLPLLPFIIEMLGLVISTAIIVAFVWYLLSLLFKAYPVLWVFLERILGMLIILSLVGGVLLGIGFGIHKVYHFFRSKTAP